MKVYVQNILFIFPVFLLMGTLLGFLKYTADKYELYWAEEEQLSAQLVTVSEFIYNDVIHYLKYNNYEEINKIKKKVSNVTRWNKINTIFLLIYPSTGGEIKNYPLLIDSSLGLDFEQLDLKKMISMLNSSEISEIIVSDDLYIENYEATEKSLFSIAGKMVLEKYGMDASLLIYSDVPGYYNTLDKIILHLLQVLIIIFILGLLVTITISFLITREIKFFHQTTSIALNSSIDSSLWLVKKNRYKGFVREFNDLNDTFIVMMSIVRNVLFRYQRRLIQGQRFRNSEDLLNLYFDKIVKKIELKTSRFYIYLQVFGSYYFEKYFWDVFESNNRTYVIFGNFNNTFLKKNSFREVNNIELQLLIVNYVKFLIQENKKNTNQIIEEILSSFSVSKLFLLDIGETDSNVSLFQIDIEKEPKIFSSQLFKDKNDPIFLHTFHHRFDLILNSLKEILNTVEVSSLYKKLEAIIPQKETGIILFLELIKKADSVDKEIAQNNKKMTENISDSSNKKGLGNMLKKKKHRTKKNKREKKQV